MPIKSIISLIYTFFTLAVVTPAAESLSFFGVDFNTPYKEAIKIFESRYQCEWDPDYLFHRCSGVIPGSKDKEKSWILNVFPLGGLSFSEINSGEYAGSTKIRQLEFNCSMYSGCGLSKDAIMQQIIKHKFQNRRRPEIWLFGPVDQDYCVDGYSGEYVCVKASRREMIWLNRGDFVEDSVSFD